MTKRAAAPASKNFRKNWDSDTLPRALGKRRIELFKKGKEPRKLEGLGPLG